MARMIERMIYESFRYNKINQIWGRNPVSQCVFVFFRQTHFSLVIKINKIS